MKQFLDIFIKPLLKQFEFEFDIKALAKFILWLFRRVTPAAIAEQLDPVFKGGKLFERVDDIAILDQLNRLKKWAEDKAK